MEACATSHHWGRTLLAMGYRVALIPAQHVKAFCRSQKNDALDAVAICEAIGRPKLHLVPVKSIAQQDIKSLRAVRQRLVTERTATGNQCRGLAAEYGVIFNLKLERLRRELPEAIELADNGLSPVARRLLQRLYDTLVSDLQGRVMGFLHEAFLAAAPGRSPHFFLPSLPHSHPFTIPLSFIFLSFFSFPLLPLPLHLR